jgi:aminoglycoside phosphotransferase (APT) family kinase protein
MLAKMRRPDERVAPRSGIALPKRVVNAAAALGVPLDSITALTGATKSSWACGDHILRTGTAQDLDREVLAMTAASSSVPVPEVLERAEFADGECAALLLTRLPGRPALDTAHATLREARCVGEACGRLHSLLALVQPPNGMRRVAAFTHAETESPSEDRLLHLDLHPLNVLVDAGGAISGVIDWANAAIGPLVLDRARTWSVLTLDPAALVLRNEPRSAALLEGWSSVAGWADLPATARAWACEYMLDDLAARYPAHRLEHVRAHLSLARSGV